MNDKEVGGLWRWLTLIDSETNTPLENKCIMLIRKLVEERAHQIDEIHDDCIGRRGLQKALDDFGIAPETFK